MSEPSFKRILRKKLSSFRLSDVHIAPVCQPVGSLENNVFPVKAWIHFDQSRGGAFVENNTS